MNESALRSLLDSLYASRSSLNGWMTFWTLLVGIGVVAEVAFALHKHLEAMDAWRRGITFPGRPSKLWFLFELIAAALVATGVSGELAIEARTGALETQIREINNQRSALRQAQTGDARQFAQGAAEAAQRAKAAAAEAETELNVLRIKAKAASASQRKTHAQSNALISQTSPAGAASNNASMAREAGAP